MWLGKKLTILVNLVKRLWDLKKENGEGIYGYWAGKGGPYDRKA